MVIGQPLLLDLTHTVIIMTVTRIFRPADQNLSHTQKISKDKKQLEQLSQVKAQNLTGALTKTEANLERQRISWIKGETGALPCHFHIPVNHGP